MIFRPFGTKKIKKLDMENDPHCPPPQYGIFQKYFFLNPFLIGIYLMSFFCDVHFGFIRYFDHKNGKIALNRKYMLSQKTPVRKLITSLTGVFWTHGLWGLKTMSNDNIKQFLIFH